MQVLSFIAQKGGAGKTTTALHVAVRASQTGRLVALVDMDPQRSAAQWHESRTAEAPLLAEATGQELAGVLSECRASRVDLVVVDTAPHSDADAATAARQSDFVLIPCRPTILDLRAIAPSIDIVAAARVRGAIVLTACPAQRTFAAPAVVSEARAALADYGLPIWPGQVTERAAFAHALNDGRAVTEFEPAGKAAAEITSLWTWIEQEMSR